MNQGDATCPAGAGLTPSTTRTLDQVIVQLRKKLDEDADAPKHLLTVHGVGYRLRA